MTKKSKLDDTGLDYELVGRRAIEVWDAKQVPVYVRDDTSDEPVGLLTYGNVLSSALECADPEANVVLDEIVHEFVEAFGTMYLVASCRKSWKAIRDAIEYVEEYFEVAGMPVPDDESIDMWEWFDYAAAYWIATMCVVLVRSSDDEPLRQKLAKLLDRYQEFATDTIEVRLNVPTTVG